MNQEKDLLQDQNDSLESTSKRIGHLGVVAGMLKKIKIKEHIDKRIPVAKEKGAKTTMGERVIAMVLNAIGFPDSRLYMFPGFLQQISIAKLMGPQVKAEYFNDDALGRCLDAIYEYGTTKLFSDIVLGIAKRHNLLGKTMHIDSTSLTLYGEYENREKPSKALDVTYGYSKAHRHDLKQVVLTMITNNKANLPIFMAGHSGNASDQKILIQAAKDVKKMTESMQEAPSFIYVADSAMYESCLDPNVNLSWLSRVPMRYKEAKTFIQNNSSYQFRPIVGKDYKIYTEEKVIKGVKQRWALIFSQQAYQREEKTLQRNIAKEQNKITKDLRHLANQKFSCQKDAQKSLQKIVKKLNFHEIKDVSYSVHKQYAKKGRPGKNDEPTGEYVQIKTTFEVNQQKVDDKKNNLGYFILATNEMNHEELSDGAMLYEYKGQQKVERGFAFIKDNTFEVSSVFLKKETRIEALMMIMCLTLFVYSLVQYHLRKQLREKGEFIKNQVKKPVQNPTAKWIFFLLNPIQEVTLSIPKIGFVQSITNLTERCVRIIKYYGEETMKLYGIGTPA